MKLKKPKKHSKKEHVQDQTKNDTFQQKKTPFVKEHEHKVPHGKFYGKRWFPQ